MTLETITVLNKLKKDAEIMFRKQGLTTNSYGWLCGWADNEIRKIEESLPTEDDFNTLAEDAKLSEILALKIEHGELAIKFAEADHDETQSLRYRLMVIEEKLAKLGVMI